MERFIEALAKIHVEYYSRQAASSFKKAGKLSAGGRIEEAVETATSGGALLDNAKGVKRLWSDFTRQLGELGIEYPTAEYFLQRLTPIASPEDEPGSATPREEPVATEKEKRAEGDLTRQEEKWAYALLSINRETGSLLFATRQDVVAHIYADELDQIANPILKKTRTTTRLGVLKYHTPKIIHKLKRADTITEQTPAHIAQLRAWVEEQPEYAGKPLDILESVMLRKTTLEQLREQDDAVQTTESEIQKDARLTTLDIYRLAQNLHGADDELLKALGIQLVPDDRDEINSIVQKSPAQVKPDKVDLREKLALIKKIMAFVKDKKTVFMANTDEDAQFILTLLAGIESEEQIRSLLK